MLTPSRGALQAWEVGFSVPIQPVPLWHLGDCQQDGVRLGDALLEFEALILGFLNERRCRQKKTKTFKHFPFFFFLK